MKLQRQQAAAKQQQQRLPALQRGAPQQQPKQQPRNLSNGLQRRLGKTAPPPRLLKDAVNSIGGLRSTPVFDRLKGVRKPSQRNPKNKLASTVQAPINSRQPAFSRQRLGNRPVAQQQQPRRQQQAPVQQQQQRRPQQLQRQRPQQVRRQQQAEAYLADYASTSGARTRQGANGRRGGKQGGAGGARDQPQQPRAMKGRGTFSY